MKGTSSSYRMVWLHGATSKVHQLVNPARGFARAAEHSRWQSAVHWFKAIAETITSQPLTSAPRSLRAFGTPRDAASLRPLAKRYVY